ncbi:MAG: putative rRNA maturation factor [Candidatus Magasanikbacteria bacterium GW2011_GWC2_45_8]|uniref:Endoribonuclease YbeY n=1 Tax=Candidatus Magasanikbacteria bacterium GW2011_GWC2_45_8 TaxID=1619050 RepID=A0A0G1R003_9BACT|nr:MAG: putative rRNA maturation factor [Candidatus Magasanikbacteria bacterium GW2011_GWC2_45_8]
MSERLTQHEVTVEPSARPKKFSSKWFLNVVETAARCARKPPRRVHIILVGDKEMCRLNTLYRNKRKTTDVLSFPALDVPPRARTLGHTSAHDDLLYLGEIVLCLPQLRRQAREYGVAFQTEAARMTIHGFLHLWGYDHIKPKDARIMMPLQEKALEQYFCVPRKMIVLTI